jgi:AcrR family transcriptional regulator
MLAAARQFVERGFDATSMRDIAAEVGMLAGSMYYHFASKEELMVTAYGEGIRQIGEALTEALAGHNDPWNRFEAACIAHLESLLCDDSAFAGLVTVDIGRLEAGIRDRLVAMRDRYERRFMRLIEDLDLSPDVDRTLLRLSLLGSLNWTVRWYHEGRDTPADIARKFVSMLRDGIDHPARIREAS